jgi:hypothetical protein
MTTPTAAAVRATLLSGLIVLLTGMDLASAAEPASRPAGRSLMEEGQRGKVLRVDEKSVIIAPLPPRRSWRSYPPEPEPAATLPADTPAEKMFKLDGNTRVAVGVVTAEHLTNTGDTVRSMEMQDGVLGDIKEGREVTILAGDDGVARQVAVFPVPLVEPRSGAGRPRTTRPARAATRPARATTRPARSPVFMPGERGKLVRVDDQSITIIPAEPTRSAPPEQQEKTFKVEPRTRVMIAQVSGEMTDPRGRSIQRVSFVSGPLTELKGGQDVVITAGDDGVAQRIMTLPPGFGDRRGAASTHRTTTSPAASEP